jgi:CO/xanthine dehydrogenase Mo-binding subunit
MAVWLRTLPSSVAKGCQKRIGEQSRCRPYIAHDTARVQAGGDSHSGRSMKLAVPVIGQATDEIIDKGRRIAGHLFEASVADIEFAAGRFRVAGTDREIGIFDIAAAAAHRTDLPPELQGPLAAISDLTLPVASFPYGTQICETRSIPRPVPSTSSATPPSTMSDARSTR